MYSSYVEFSALLVIVVSEDNIFRNARQIHLLYTPSTGSDLLSQS